MMDPNQVDDLTKTSDEKKMDETEDQSEMSETQIQVNGLKSDHLVKHLIDEVNLNHTENGHSDPIINENSNKETNGNDVDVQNSNHNSEPSKNENHTEGNEVFENVDTENSAKYITTLTSHCVSLVTLENQNKENDKSSIENKLEDHSKAPQIMEALKSTIEDVFSLESNEKASSDGKYDTVTQVENILMEKGVSNGEIVRNCEPKFISSLVSHCVSYEKDNSEQEKDRVSATLYEANNTKKEQENYQNSHSDNEKFDQPTIDLATEQVESEPNFKMDFKKEEEKNEEENITAHLVQEQREPSILEVQDREQEKEPDSVDKISEVVKGLVLDLHNDSENKLTSTNEGEKHEHAKELNSQNVQEREEMNPSVVQNDQQESEDNTSDTVSEIVKGIALAMHIDSKTNVEMVSKTDGETNEDVVITADLTQEQKESTILEVSGIAQETEPDSIVPISEVAKGVVLAMQVDSAANVELISTTEGDKYEDLEKRTEDVEDLTSQDLKDLNSSEVENDQQKSAPDTGIPVSEISKGIAFDTQMDSETNAEMVSKCEGELKEGEDISSYLTLEQKESAVLKVQEMEQETEPDSVDPISEVGKGLVLANQVDSATDVELVSTTEENKIELSEKRNEDLQDITSHHAQELKEENSLEVQSVPQESELNFGDPISEVAKGTALAMVVDSETNVEMISKTEEEKIKKDGDIAADLAKEQNEPTIIEVSDQGQETEPDSVDPISEVGKGLALANQVDSATDVELVSTTEENKIEVSEKRNEDLQDITSHHAQELKEENSLEVQSVPQESEPNFGDPISEVAKGTALAMVVDSETTVEMFSKTEEEKIKDGDNAADLAKEQKEPTFIEVSEKEQETEPDSEDKISEVAKGLVLAMQVDSASNVELISTTEEGKHEDLDTNIENVEELISQNAQELKEVNSLEVQSVPQESEPDFGDPISEIVKDTALALVVDSETIVEMVPESEGEINEDEDLTGNLTQEQKEPKVLKDSETEQQNDPHYETIVEMVSTNEPENSENLHGSESIGCISNTEIATAVEVDSLQHLVEPDSETSDKIENSQNEYSYQAIGKEDSHSLKTSNEQSESEPDSMNFIQEVIKGIALAKQQKLDTKSQNVIHPEKTDVFEKQIDASIEQLPSESENINREILINPVELQRDVDSLDSIQMKAKEIASAKILDLESEDKIAEKLEIDLETHKPFIQNEETEPDSFDPSQIQLGKEIAKLNLGKKEDSTKTVLPSLNDDEKSHVSIVKTEVEPDFTEGEDTDVKDKRNIFVCEQSENGSKEKDSHEPEMSVISSGKPVEITDIKDNTFSDIQNKSERKTNEDDCSEKPDQEMEPDSIEFGLLLGKTIALTTLEEAEKNEKYNEKTETAEINPKMNLQMLKDESANSDESLDKNKKDVEIDEINPDYQLTESDSIANKCTENKIIGQEETDSLISVPEISNGFPPSQEESKIKDYDLPLALEDLNQLQLSQEAPETTEDPESREQEQDSQVSKELGQIQEVTTVVLNTEFENKAEAKDNLVSQLKIEADYIKEILPEDSRKNKSSAFVKADDNGPEPDHSIVDIKSEPTIEGDSNMPDGQAEKSETELKIETQTNTPVLEEGDTLVKTEEAQNNTDEKIESSLETEIDSQSLTEFHNVESNENNEIIINNDKASKISTSVPNIEKDIKIEILPVGSSQKENDFPNTQPDIESAPSDEKEINIEVLQEDYSSTKTKTSGDDDDGSVTTKVSESQSCSVQVQHSSSEDGKEMSSKIEASESSLAKLEKTRSEEVSSTDEDGFTKTSVIKSQSISTVSKERSSTKEVISTTSEIDSKMLSELLNFNQEVKSKGDQPDSLTAAFALMGSQKLVTTSQVSTRSQGSHSIQVSSISTPEGQNVTRSEAHEATHVTTKSDSQPEIIIPKPEVKIPEPRMEAEPIKPEVKPSEQKPESKSPKKPERKGSAANKRPTVGKTDQTSSEKKPVISSAPEVNKGPKVPPRTRDNPTAGPRRSSGQSSSVMQYLFGCIPCVGHPK